ncbi:MAG: HD domain-containing protein [Gammaproteobacteria bacterium]|nr:HD domain-containing protein [Gammaproteobacteria bacterium]
MSVDESLYIKNIAELGETEEVTVSDDVHAENGMKLLAKGTRINRSVLNRLLRHKLVKPIDQTTMINDAINRETLVTAAGALMDNNTEMGRLLRQLRDSNFPQRVFNRVRLLPVVCNKLTVAQRLYEPLFLHSLRVALAASVVGEQLGCSEAELETLATAGLVHDIGALHIEASQLHQSEQLRSEHWRQIYTHPWISHLILEEFQEYTPHISRAVLEHHERMDGSGYPHGLKGSQISRAGRILSFVDFSVATSQKLGLRHMFTIVKIHPRAFEREVVQVLAGIVRNFDEVLQPSVPRIEIGVLRNLMATVSETLSSAPMEIPLTVANPSPQLKTMMGLLQRTVQALTLMVHRIGFELKNVEFSIGRLEGDPVLQTELEVLLHEIHFRLRGLILELHRYRYADENCLKGFDLLQSWIIGTEAKVNRMRELFPDPSESDKAA